MQDLSYIATLKRSNTLQLTGFPKRYKSVMIDILNMLASVMSWNQYLEFIGEIRFSNHDPFGRGTTKAYVQAGIVTVGDLFFTPIEKGDQGEQYLANRVFTLLHELYHSIQSAYGIPYGGLDEEKRANNFADWLLNKKGLSRNYKNSYDEACQILN